MEEKDIVKVTHVVQEGETLSGLTRLYTGGSDYNTVAQNNDIRDANKINIGQEITFEVDKNSEYAKSNPNVFSNPNIDDNLTDENIEATAKNDQIQENVSSSSTGVTSDETIDNNNSSFSLSNDKPINDSLVDENNNFFNDMNSTESYSQMDSIIVPSKSFSNNFSKKFDNKWLFSNCPNVTSPFEVDKSHSEGDYYIGYLNAKNGVEDINGDWKSIKSAVVNLKSNIEELKKSIDSQDYKSQTKGLLETIDQSIANLDQNFIALFDAVVKRLEQAAETDSWFSENALEYAAYINESILGKTNPVNNSEQIISAVASSSEISEEQSASDLNVDVPTDNSSFSNDSAAASLGLTAEQLDVVKATIRHEAGNNPTEMLAVASVIKNRMDAGNWGGTDPYSIVTAKSQFQSYYSGNYSEFTNGNYFQGGTETDVENVSQQINAILTGSTAPITTATQFRSSAGEGRTQYTEGGNYYF